MGEAPLYKPDHYLKVPTEHFKQLVLGHMSFIVWEQAEGVKTGDYIRLQEIMNAMETDWYLEGKVGYILDDDALGIRDGYVVFSFVKYFFHKEGKESEGEQKFKKYQVYYEERNVFGLQIPESMKRKPTKTTKKKNLSTK